MADYRKMVGEYLKLAMKQPYKLGEQDCLTFAIDWVNMMDTTAELTLPRYDSAEALYRAGLRIWGDHTHPAPSASSLFLQALNNHLRRPRWHSPYFSAKTPKTGFGSEGPRCGDVVVFTADRKMLLPVCEQKQLYGNALGARWEEKRWLGIGIGAASKGHIAHRIHQGIAVFEPEQADLVRIWRWRGEDG